MQTNKEGELRIKRVIHEGGMPEPDKQQQYINGKWQDVPVVEVTRKYKNVKENQN